MHPIHDEFTTARGLRASKARSQSAHKIRGRLFSSLLYSLLLMSALFPSVACDTKPPVPAVDIDSGDIVKVVGANRGHELVVEKHGIKATLRLVGIYTFAASINEKSDISVYANLSKDFALKELMGKDVTLVLEREQPDKRGRYLGFIEVDGKDFNQRLIEEGQAVIYTEYPFSREAAYFKAEAAPRKSRRGMWSGKHSYKRLKALRNTWASVRRNTFGSPVKDPVLHD